MSEMLAQIEVKAKRTTLSEVQQLEKNLAEINESVSRLQEKLGPILIQTENKSGELANPKVKTGSELAGHIANLSEQARNVIHRVDELIHSVDL